MADRFEAGMMTPDRQAQDVVEGRPKKKRPFRYCSDCEHFFDARDKRSFLAKEGEPYGDLCPLCAMMTLRGTEAWAVWNDCNGVFADQIFATAERAAEEVTVEHAAVGGRVKPVRIYVDADVLRNMQADALIVREIPFGDAPDSSWFGG